MFFFVVPTLNSSNTLSRLVLSLESQSFVDWRVLFVDGGSDKYNLDYDSLVSEIGRTSDVLENKIFLGKLK